MKTGFRTKIALTCLAGAVALGACTPSVANRGNLVPDSKLAQIRPEISSRYDVNQFWGPPTAVSPFDENTWYYIGEKTETMGVFRHEVTDRRIIAVRFDDMDRVIAIREIDSDKAKDIKVVGRKTPTAGKEYTVLQQFVGNLGRFNSAGGGKPSGGLSVPGPGGNN